MSAPWLPFHRPRADSRLRLFCFPYAGAGASLFRPWAEVLPAGMELCAVQLPGREARLSEPPFTSMLALMGALDEALAPLLEERPFAFFGHSLGALLAFELTRHLRRRGGPVPRYLFVSGAPGPGLPRSGPPLHALPEPEFLQAVRLLSGGSDAVLGNAEFADVWGRLMRADLQLAETYQLLPEPVLDVPIAAFGGVADPTVSREELATWSEQTRGGFSQHMLPGGHLFVRASYPSIIRVLWQKLRGLVPGL
jgi:medium-chain acyl-[acyl-carrier-protein] hydrolase